MKRVAKLFGLTLLVMILGLVVLVATDPGDNVELIEASVTEQARGERVLAASIRFAAQQHHVEVQLDVLAENGDLLARKVHQAGPVEAGGTWDLEFLIEQRNAALYRLHRLVCSPTPDSSDWERKRACALTHEGALG